MSTVVVVVVGATHFMFLTWPLKSSVHSQSFFVEQYILQTSAHVCLPSAAVESMAFIEAAAVDRVGIGETERKTVQITPFGL